MGIPVNGHGYPHDEERDKKREEPSDNMRGAMNPSPFFKPEHFEESHFFPPHPHLGCCG